MSTVSKLLLVFVSAVILLSCGSDIWAAESAKLDQHVTYLVDLAQKNFWGKARLPSGTYVQPDSEEERQRVPISVVDAKRIVIAATPAAMAEWCGMEWKRYYVSFMKGERQKNWNEKQLAFIGILFGIAQGNIEKSLNKSQCTEKERASVAKTMRNIPE